MKYLFYKSLVVILVSTLFISCSQEELTGTSISQLFHLEHKGATMPILVEGNIDSNVIVLILHGGPGGSARIYNTNLTKMSNQLESNYAVAYWDQRGAGNSRANTSAPEINLALMTEDLDKVVDLLKFKFGENKKIFLLGHSWGGMLGTSYLINEYRQQKIAGWIEVCGAHDFSRTVIDAYEAIENIAIQQINNEISVNKWNEFLNILLPIDKYNVSNDEATLINKQGAIAEKQAVKDGLINELDLTSFQSFSSLYSAFFYDQSITSKISNNIQFRDSYLYNTEIVGRLSLSDKLYKITKPSLLMYGKYDMVVPFPQGVEAINKIGTANDDKNLIVFEHSGHIPFDSEVDLFLNHLNTFIDQYK